MALLWAIARAVASSLNGWLVLGFGYVLPGLASVKAVLHRDVQAARHLMIHFVILHLLHAYTLGPLFSFGAVHSALELPLILWLSLPRFQGSLIVYRRVLVPLLYRFEGHVDEGVDGAKAEIRKRLLSFMMGAGWTLLNQFWEALRPVPTAAEGGPSSIASSTSEKKGMGTADSDSNAKDGEPRLRRRRPLDPQHSVIGSLSSLRSSQGDLTVMRSTDETVDMDADDPESEAYVEDFLRMLSRGLYVFAHTRGSGSCSSSSRGDTNDDPREKKTFVLRIFSHEQGADAFLISSVDACLHNEDGGNDDDDDAVLLLPVADITDVVESGAQGIVIRLNDDSSTTAEIVLSDEADRDTLLQGLDSCLFVLKDKEKKEETEEGNDDDDDAQSVADEGIEVEKGIEHVYNGAKSMLEDRFDDGTRSLDDEEEGGEGIEQMHGADKSMNSFEDNNHVRALAADNFEE